jgi:hypothetical protein
MMRRILPPLAALAVCLFALGAHSANDESSGPVGMDKMHNWAADHEALLDAKLAGLKAGLKLTSDQEKLWPPFETVVRDAAKVHMEQMKSMMDRMQKMPEAMQSMKKSEDTKEMAVPGQAVSPVDRLEALGHRMSESGGAITKVADAAKPLYASLDDSQKRLFVLLGRELFMMGHGHRGMEMMRGGMKMMGGGLMDQGDMDMMGRKSDRMESMGNGPGEEEDDPDEE